MHLPDWTTLASQAWGYWFLFLQSMPETLALSSSEYLWNRKIGNRRKKVERMSLATVVDEPKSRHIVASTECECLGENLAQNVEHGKFRIYDRHAPQTAESVWKELWPVPLWACVILILQHKNGCESFVHNGRNNLEDLKDFCLAVDTRTQDQLFSYLTHCN